MRHAVTHGEKPDHRVACESWADALLYGFVAMGIAPGGFPATDSVGLSASALVEKCA